MVTGSGYSHAERITSRRGRGYRGSTVGCGRSWMGRAGVDICSDGLNPFRGYGTRWTCFDSAHRSQVRNEFFAVDFAGFMRGLGASHVVLDVSGSAPRPSAIVLSPFRRGLAIADSEISSCEQVWCATQASSRLVHPESAHVGEAYAEVIDPEQ